MMLTKPDDLGDLGTSNAHDEPFEGFNAMLARDPDGRRTQPTAVDYEHFRTWVITTYGRQGWNRYCTWFNQD